MTRIFTLEQDEENKKIQAWKKYIKQLDLEDTSLKNYLQYFNPNYVLLNDTTRNIKQLLTLYVVNERDFERKNNLSDATCTYVLSQGIFYKKNNSNKYEQIINLQDERDLITGIYRGWTRDLNKNKTVFLMPFYYFDTKENPLKFYKKEDSFITVSDDEFTKAHFIANESITLNSTEQPFEFILPFYIIDDTQEKINLNEIKIQEKNLAEDGYYFSEETLWKVSNHTSTKIYTKKSKMYRIGFLGFREGIVNNDENAFIQFEKNDKDGIFHNDENFFLITESLLKAKISKQEISNFLSSFVVICKKWTHYGLEQWKNPQKRDRENYLIIPKIKPTYFLPTFENSNFIFTMSENQLSTMNSKLVFSLDTFPVRYYYKYPLNFYGKVLQIPNIRIQNNQTEPLVKTVNNKVWTNNYPLMEELYIKESENNYERLFGEIETFVSTSNIENNKVFYYNIIINTKEIKDSFLNEIVTEIF